MIAPPAPNSPIHAVLATVVTYPGELDTDAIAAHLWPPPKLTLPLTSRDAWIARAAAVAEHRRVKAAQVARCLHRLVQAGYVERVGPPRVATWFMARVERWGDVEALARAHPAWPRPAGDLRGHVRMLAEVRVGPPTVRALLGSEPSGARKRAYADLVSWGVIVAPSQRWPTEAGRARIERGAA